MTLEIAEEDVIAAMKEIPGYLDITPGDFKEVYQLFYRHAAERLTQSIKGKEVMTREVVAVTQDMLLPQVAEVMARRRVPGCRCWTRPER